MDTARIKGVEPPIHIAAQELRAWRPDEVKATEFSCIGCTADVHPKAYEMNRRVQAHFSLYRFRSPHDAGCSEGPLAAAATSSSDEADNEIPTVACWPTRLVETPMQRKVVDPDAALPAAVDRRNSTRSVGVGKGGGGRPSASARAYSIRPFAHAFSRMNRGQREREPIVLPGVDANRYAFAFKRLPQWTIEPLKYPLRVFYGQLRWAADVDDTGSEFRIPLHAGEWDSEQKRFARTWELRVDHTGWATRARAAFLNELESAKNQARDEGKQPWFFALTAQRRGEPGVIETGDRRLVAFFPLTDAEAARLAR
ncbi:hypothetical protein [Mycolicibacterium tusciae]|uniref:hypothetical protein n=1 Tax=Mycolicibacterium tusciae TaxID=75922 RepID=UPI00024A3F26|nr:hypothetical protein [Mycolicibacterium tusciae]